MLRTQWEALWESVDNVERRADHGDLACEVSEGSSKSPSKTLLGAFDILISNIVPGQQVEQASKQHSSIACASVPASLPVPSSFLTL